MILKICVQKHLPEFVKLTDLERLVMQIFSLKIVYFENYLMKVTIGRQIEIYIYV